MIDYEWLRGFLASLFEPAFLAWPVLMVIGRLTRGRKSVAVATCISSSFAGLVYWDEVAITAGLWETGYAPQSVSATRLFVTSLIVIVVCAPGPWFTWMMFSQWRRNALSPQERDEALQRAGRMGAGWYPDQTNPEMFRWWDGAAWTAQTLPAGRPGEPTTRT